MRIGRRVAAWRCLTVHVAGEVNLVRRVVEDVLQACCRRGNIIDRCDRASDDDGKG